MMNHPFDEKMRTASLDIESRNGHATDFEQSEALLPVQRPAYLRRHQSRTAWVVHVVVGLINVLLFLFLTRNHLRGQAQMSAILAAPYSPAEGAISYENTAFNVSLFQKNKYSGDPRPEQAEAWGELMDHMGLWVTEEELTKLNRTSIKVPGQGYLAELEMFHQLHCLDYIRQYIYSDYYPIHESERTIRTHVSHCIDALRQSIQCQGNTAIVTYSWREDYERPWPDFQINKQCRNYDALKSWAKSRKVTNKFEKNPIFDMRYKGSSPPSQENATELVQGTRLNIKLMQELESTQAKTY